MLIPVRLFDLVLGPDAAPSVTIAREDAAARAVDFLKQLAAAGALLDAEGEAIGAEGIAYHPRSAELATAFTTMAEARAAGVAVDDAAIETLLKNRTAPPPTHDPELSPEVADEPPLEEEAKDA